MASSRSKDPHTSHEAARKAESGGSAGLQRDKCLAVVRQCPGLTAAEIAERAGLERHASSRRLPELRAAGYVFTGQARSCSVGSLQSLTWWPSASATIPGEKALPTVTDGPASADLFAGQPDPTPKGWGRA